MRSNWLKRFCRQGSRASISTHVFLPQRAASGVVDNSQRAACPALSPPCCMFRLRNGLQRRAHLERPHGIWLALNHRHAGSGHRQQPHFLSPLGGNLGRVRRSHDALASRSLVPRGVAADSSRLGALRRLASRGQWTSRFATETVRPVGSQCPPGYASHRSCFCTTGGDFIGSLFPGSTCLSAAARPLACGHLEVVSRLRLWLLSRSSAAVCALAAINKTAICRDSCTDGPPESH
jgi:hypothetical protein